MERAERIIALGVGLLFDSDPHRRPVGDARPHPRHRRAAVREGVAAGVGPAAPAVEPLEGAPGRPAHRAGVEPAPAHQPPLAAAPTVRRGPRHPRGTRRPRPSPAAAHPVAAGRPRSDGSPATSPASAGPRSSATSAGSTPRSPTGRLRRLVDETFESYARYYEESFRLPGTSAEDLDAGFTPTASSTSSAALAAGDGAIMAMPHLGGWEWSGFWVTQVKGHPVTAVVEELEPATSSSGSSSCAGRSASRSWPSVPARAPPPHARSRPTTCWPSCATATSPAPAPRSSSSASAPRCRADRPRSRCAPGRRSSRPRSTSTARPPARVVLPPLDTTRGQGKLRDDVQRVTQDLAHASRT